MGIIKSYLVFFVLSIVPTLLFSCSCINPPTRFFQSIDDDAVILRAKVLQHHTFEGESWPAVTITSLQVLKWYKNKLKKDTVYFQNGDGGSCGGGIQGWKEVGEEIILKTYQDTSSLDIFELDKLGLDLYEDMPTYKTFLASLDKSLLLSAGICHVWFLEVEGKQVRGNITKSIYHKLWKRKELLEKISAKLGEWYYGKKIVNQDLRQSMGMGRFERKVRRKF